MGRGDQDPVSALGPTALANLRSVASRHGLRLLCLHGSRAAGRAAPESDLDLAAWFGDAGRALAAEGALLADLARALPPGAPDLDLAVLDVADPLLQFLVVSSGLPIYEAPPGSWVEFSMRAAALYWDSAKYRQRTRQYLSHYNAGLPPGERPQ